MKPGGVWVDVVSNCTMGLGTRCLRNWAKIRPPKQFHNAFQHNTDPVSTSKPLFQSEAKCEATDSHANKSHFHKTGFALGLFFKVRAIGTKKRTITVKYVTGPSYRNNAPRFHRILAL